VLAGQGRQRAAPILRGDHELWRRFPGAAGRHAERHAFRAVQRGVQRPVHPVVFDQPHVHQVVAELARGRQAADHRRHRLRVHR